MDIPAKAESLGGEVAGVVALSFIFVLGIALGSIATHIMTYVIKSRQSPPPAGPAAEARTVKEIGTGKQASII